MTVRTQILHVDMLLSLSVNKIQIPLAFFVSLFVLSFVVFSRQLSLCNSDGWPGTHYSVDWP